MPKRKNKSISESKRRRIRIISSDSSGADENADPNYIQNNENILHASPCAPLQNQQDGEVPPSIPELPPEILSALGDSTDDTPDFGENIHPNLAERWLPILRKGLDSDSKAKLWAEHKIPANCTLLKSPTINPEIAVAITESLKARDKKLEMAQQQLGLGITAVNKAITLLLNGDDKIQAIKVLSDSCRILADLHYVRTEHRVNLLTPSLDKSFLDIVEDKERDETLFGKSLSDKIKTAKAIEKQGLQIKKITQPASSLRATPSTSRGRNQGNWSVPPHFPANRRGGRGGYRANSASVNQFAQRRVLPPPSPAAAAANRFRNTTSSKYNQRVPRRH